MRRGRSTLHEIGPALLALILLLGPTGRAYPEPALALPVLDLVVERGRLSVRLEAATPREALLGALAREAGLTVVLRGDLGDAPPQHLDQIELATAIRRLTGPGNHLLMRFAPRPAGDSRLVSVRVEGGRGSGDARPERVIAPPAPATLDRGPDVFEAPGVRLVRLAPDAAHDPAVTDRLKDQIYRHGREGGIAAVAGLAETLRGEPDPALRRLAANTLLNLAIGSTLDPATRRAATATFVAALDDPSGAVRSEAMRGLGVVAGRSAGRHIARVASADSDPELRRQAVHLLVPLGGTAGRSALEAAASDADPTVRQAADRATRRSTRQAHAGHPRP